MKTSLLCLAAGLGIFGCTSPSFDQRAQSDLTLAQHRADVATASIGTNAGDASPGSAKYADALAKDQAKRPVMRRSKAAFIGAQMVPVTHDDQLPSIFKREFAIAFDDAKAGRLVSLQVVANRLSDKTGVPIRIAADVYPPTNPTGSTTSPLALPAMGASPNVVPALLPSIPPGPGTAPTLATPLTSPAAATAPMVLDVGDMKWHGTLTDYLNHLTDRLGLAWEYRDNTIVIMKFVIESHEIATFNSATTYAMTTGGSATGASGGLGAQTATTNQLAIAETGVIDALASIERAVKDMLASVPGSSVTRSEGSGRLQVKTTREMQSQVRDFIKSENASMLRQAQIQFDIYSVRTTDADERGINWNLVLNSLSGLYGATSASPATLTGATDGNISVNILNTGTSETSRRYGGSTAIINLLNQYGTNVQHRPVSLLGLNRSWARKSRLDTEHYLAETTPGPASSTGVGAPGLKLDKVTTGDQYVALPHILDNNTVLLKFGISLSDLLGLFDVTVGQGQTTQKVQAPHVQSVSDQYSVKLEPGQVMAISGLSRLVTTTDRRALGEETSIWFGGSKKTNVMHEHFVIFVRPVIL